ncbi:MAG: radical SAM protein [Lentisphaerae bacterium]|nr:radical SAM protein [Lentisphaerota bacterium]
MSNILLIKTSKSNLPDKGLSPPLGILYLIAYLRKHRPADVIKMIDLRLERDGGQAIATLCRDFVPDIIGFSTMTIEANNMHVMAQWCKQRFPLSRIIVGGPHATSFGRHVIADPNIDYVLAGEGEAVFLKLLNAIDHGSPLSDLPGLSYRKPDGTIISRAPTQELLDLTTLPPPAWDLHNFDRYTDSRMSPISLGRYAALFTSRGCPYQCTYCHSIFSKRYRALPPLQVVDDIEYLINTYNIQELEIYDDSFNLHYNRTMAICDEIIRRGLKIRLLFPNGVRGDLLDEALIKRLRQAGTIYMVFAVESASERIQQAIKKNVNLDKIRQNIRIAARAGIFTWGFFMMGFPGETRRELWRTAKYAIASALHGGFFFIVVPQAGTELGRQVGVDAGNYATIKAADYFATRNTISAVSHWELWLWQLLTCFFFYAHPARLYRILKDYPYSPGAFCRKAFRRGLVFLFVTFLRNVSDRLRSGKKHARVSPVDEALRC